MKLFPTQEQHLEALCDILESNQIACDTSITGSGKTICAVKIAQKYGLDLYVVAPPTLRDNWVKTCAGEKCPLTFVSIAKLATVPLPRTRVILVADECHAFKNANQRTSDFKRLLLSPSIFYVLLLSATPIDHPRHLGSFSSLLKGKDISSVCHNMCFTHRTSVSYDLYYILQTEEELEEYHDGRRAIYSATDFGGLAGEVLGFNGGAFSYGMKHIHNSLIKGLIRYIEAGKLHQKKLIICLKYEEHFKVFKKMYPVALVLNGKTPMYDRKSIISKFQEPSMEYPIMLLSAAVGGVGVDLDDSNGQFPRLIVSLPLFASEFVQLVGRVQRRNTLSDAKVVIIQPRAFLTYFRHQMKVKSKVLQIFGTKVDMDAFEKIWEHEEDCTLLHLRKYSYGIPDGVIGIVAAYSCSCKFTKSLFKLR